MQGATPTFLLDQQCTAGDSPVGAIRLQHIYSELDFEVPVAMAQAPGNDDAWMYIANKRGTILALPTRDDAGNDEAIEAARLRVHTSGESGIADLAFHPDYENNGKLYVTYSAKVETGAYELRLSELQRELDGTTFGSERILMRIPQDYNIHYGGGMAFGPDGYLYIGVGDDGNNLTGDANLWRAQDTDNFYGSILRIDVDNPGSLMPYGIPTDNPFVGTNGINEVWAYGFRNPWRISFDRQRPGGLWNSNVGSNHTEEINLVEAGQNYGWPVCEGPCSSPVPEMVDPVHHYPNSGGAAVIGGFVYRGTRIPELQGKYVFGDHVTQQISALDLDREVGDPNRVKVLASTGIDISSFAQDNSGELYVLGLRAGGIYRIERADEGVSVSMPEQLSETGCFASLEGGRPRPADGVYPYRVAQRFWSDGANKERLLSIPAGSAIDVSDALNWSLPRGGVAIKHFYLDDRPIETRFLLHYLDGAWGGFSYEWNAQSDDATLVEFGGKTSTISDQQWTYPSRGDCLRCHTEQAGYTLSLETRQLNLTGEPAVSNSVGQIAQMASHGLLSSLAPELLPPFPGAKSLLEPEVDLQERAYSWLHVNCSSCHRGVGSSGRASWDARYDTHMNDRVLCDQIPIELTNMFEAEHERVVLPGDHEYSTLWIRATARSSALSMPPIGSAVSDPVGSELVGQWIDSLKSECQVE